MAFNVTLKGDTIKIESTFGENLSLTCPAPSRQTLLQGLEGQDSSVIRSVATNRVRAAALTALKSVGISASWGAVTVNMGEF